MKKTIVILISIFVFIPLILIVGGIYYLVSILDSTKGLELSKIETNMINATKEYDKDLIFVDFIPQGNNLFEGVNGEMHLIMKSQNGVEFNFYLGNEHIINGSEFDNKHIYGDYVKNNLSELFLDKAKKEYAGISFIPYSNDIPTNNNKVFNYFYIEENNLHTVITKARENNLTVKEYIFNNKEEWFKNNIEIVTYIYSDNVSSLNDNIINELYKNYSILSMDNYYSLKIYEDKKDESSFFDSLNTDVFNYNEDEFKSFIQNYDNYKELY